MREFLHDQNTEEVIGKLTLNFREKLSCKGILNLLQHLMVSITLWIWLKECWIMAIIHQQFNSL